jgi:hypothetical protein
VTVHEPVPLRLKEGDHLVSGSGIQSPVELRDEMAIADALRPGQGVGGTGQQPSNEIVDGGVEVLRFDGPVDQKNSGARAMPPSPGTMPKGAPYGSSSARARCVSPTRASLRAMMKSHPNITAGAKPMTSPLTRAMTGFSMAAMAS